MTNQIEQDKDTRRRMESGNCAVYKKVKKTVVGEVEMKLIKTTTQRGGVEFLHTLFMKSYKYQMLRIKAKISLEDSTL